MDTDILRFFELLRSGLWQKKADIKLFGKDTDWQTIYTLSFQQSVTAVVFDGIQTLPSELHPPRMLSLKWCSLTAQIEQANETINATLKEITQCLQTHAIPHVLLKGQGLASLYPHPLRRQCGDIDLFFKDSDFQSSKILFKTLKLPRLTCKTEKHTEYLWSNILLESHHIPHYFNYPPFNRYLKKIINQWYPNTGNYLTLKENRICIPPPTFNAIYLPMHILHHLLSEGVGLRQLCDWTILLHQENKRIDFYQLRKDISAFRFHRVMKALGYIAVQYLGLPEGKLPIPITSKDKKQGEKIIQHILEGGNFGKYSEEKTPQSANNFSARIHNYSQVCRHCYRYLRLAPEESLSYPFSKIRFFTVKLWRK